MNIKVLACLAFVALVAVTEISAHCNKCLGQGRDFCACNRHVVRPVPLERVPQPPCPRTVCKRVGCPPTFRPIGDVCSCGNHVVRPAIVPRQPCQLNNPNPAKCSCQSCAGTIRAPHAYQGASAPSIYVSQNHKHVEVVKVPHIPADAVSLSIAYKMAHTACHSIPESQLHGIEKIPRELQHRTRPSVDEEKLYAVHRAIMELKPAQCKKDKSSSESESSEEKHKPHHHGPSYLSYGDIGYQLAHKKPCHFEVHTQVHTHVPHTIPCQDKPSPVHRLPCGLKLGAVELDRQSHHHHEDSDESGSGHGRYH